MKWLRPMRPPLIKPQVLRRQVMVLLIIIAGNGMALAQSFQAVKKCLFIYPSKSAQLTPAEKNDMLALQNSVYVSGIAFNKVNISRLTSEKLEKYDLLIVPAATASGLTTAQTDLLAAAVRKGGNLMFDNISKLNDELGIRLHEKNIQIRRVRDLQFPTTTLYWYPAASIKTIKVSDSLQKPLVVDDSTQRPIVISGRAGSGRYLYFSTYFDPHTVRGYSRFPFLVEMLKSQFGIHPLAERKAMEIYFDPGMRDTVSITDLVAFWRANNIKRIHAGGWYYDEDFDYEKLITSCHQNGILVYCWFEAPMISRTFWDKHPEWREKTVYNRDAAIDWRLLMNLADTSCRKQIFSEWHDFLMKNDFDGVNFAELYFEPSPVGPNLPENFTPMNQQLRKAFKQKSGFDPVQLFDPKSIHYWKKNNADWQQFAQYRKNLLFQLKDLYLGFLDDIKNQKKDFELMLTPLDVSLTPELSDYIAEDTQNTLALYRKYKLSLQVEDPSNCWGLAPERYLRMGSYYRRYVKETNKLLFDCNVVGSHENGEGGFAAEKPTGEEIRQVTYFMSLHINRPVFYSEDAINPNDWLNISQTLARDTKITTSPSGAWQIMASHTVMVHTGGPQLQLNLDHKPWLAGEADAVIIPRGAHMLETNVEPETGSFTRILRISGELLNAAFTADNLQFTYSEDYVPCYITITKQPAAIYIDGQLTKCPVFAGLPAEYTVKLPSGTHQVQIK